MEFGNIQWESPNTVIVTGPSKSGKTTFVDKIVRNHQFLFKKDKIRPVILYTLLAKPQKIYNALTTILC